MNSKLNDLICKMIEYNSHDPKRISHFIKVHALARLIGEKESLDSENLFALETVHIQSDNGGIRCSR